MMITRNHEQGEDHKATATKLLHSVKLLALCKVDRLVLDVAVGALQPLQLF